MAPLHARPLLLFRDRLCVRQQRRPFMGLRRPPPPKPSMMGYLVLQGLGIVLLADLAIASIQREPTVVKSVIRSAGFWNETPPFEKVHNTHEESTES